jgi:hypothetical protein
MIKKYITTLTCFALLSTELFAQMGPGLGNLTYTSAELNKGLWTYKEVNNYGSTMATMHGGYMITTFHPDSGKPPGGILVWDVSNPRRPVQVGRVYNNQTSTFREQHALPQYDKYIMMQDGFGIQIWDFSNPRVPVLTKRHIISGYAHDDYGSCWQIFWQAPYVYIANGSKGFDVLDATDINNPVFVKHITAPRQVGGIFAIGNILYTTAHDFGKGFTLYDISNPRDPKLLNSYANTENMYAGIVNGNKMIVSARGNTNNAIFGTYDVTDPVNIKKITTLNIGNSAEQLYCSTQDEFIFQGCQYEIVKIDASVPTSQRVVGRGLVVTTNPDHGQVTPFGNLIFAGNDHGSGSGFFVHQTSPDNRAPEVNMVVPKSNDVNRALTSRIGITLTDNILHETINKNTFIVRPIGGAALNGKYSYQSSIANFAPDQPLLANTTYEIVIPAGGMKDYAGNPITKAFTSYFSTGPTGNFPPVAGSAPTVFEGDKQVRLNWPVVPNAVRYVVKRATSLTGTFQTVATVTQATYTDLNLENDSYYYYTVTGENASGQGVASAVVRAMPSLYITDLTWTSATNGWGVVEKDMSNGEQATNDGTTITLNEVTYSRGIGVHANSTVTYNLEGKYARFLSDVGVDDEVAGNGSVIFRVVLDGRELYNSALMTGATATKTIDVDVTGGSQLQLIVSGDANVDQDHASWGGARLKSGSKPFNTVAHTIPGRIQTEEYDLGGQGIGYFEADANGNQGGATFRNDQVDIETCTDLGGGYNIGYALQGEWLKYTVNVLTTKSYGLDLRLAADGAGKLMHIEVDGVDVTGPITVPNTGGWQTWTTHFVKDIQLTKGTHVVRIVFDASYMNVNYMEFRDLIPTGLESMEILGLKMYPNPFANGLRIEGNHQYSYSITDLSGALLETGEAQGEQTIGTKLNAGIYMLSLKTSQGVVNQKIVKQ